MSIHQPNYREDEPVTFVSPETDNDKAVTGELNANTSGSYPPAEAEYDETVRNSEVFYDKLKQFHSSFDTKLTFPTIGGQTLDLHRLFVEVTSRGGFEKIIGDRKWKEVVSAFNFPATITSGSFVLRKYYLSLLYHFEQAYYFRKRVATTSLAGTGTRTSVDPISQSPNTEAELPGGRDLGTHDESSLDTGGRDLGIHDKSSLDTVTPNLRPGVTLVGVIDAKFDNGYIVSVNLGSEELKGILYHIPNPNTEVTQTSWNSDISTASCRRRKNSRLGRKRDPLKPKQNRNSYNFFFAENYSRLKPLYHGRERAISKRIADLWSNLSESEKQVYHEKGVRDKERYKTEMSEYKSAANT